MERGAGCAALGAGVYTLYPTPLSCHPRTHKTLIKAPWLSQMKRRARLLLHPRTLDARKVPGVMRQSDNLVVN